MVEPRSGLNTEVDADRVRGRSSDSEFPAPAPLGDVEPEYVVQREARTTPWDTGGRTYQPIPTGRGVYRPVGTNVEEHRPRYYGGGYEDGQYRPSSVVAVGVGKPESWILETQSAMQRAGLLSEGSYIPGFWDNDTQEAMSDLMGYANQQGMTWEDALAMILEQGGVGGDGGMGGMGGGGLARIQRAPEWALNQLLDDAGTAYLGRNFTDQEKQQFIAAYRGLEDASREQGMESAETIARAFAQRSDPVAFAANKAVDVYDTILQTLTGGAV